MKSIFKEGIMFYIGVLNSDLMSSGFIAQIIAQ